MPTNVVKLPEMSCHDYLYLRNYVHKKYLKCSVTFLRDRSLGGCRAGRPVTLYSRLSCLETPLCVITAQCLQLTYSTLHNLNLRFRLTVSSNFKHFSKGMLHSFFLVLVSWYIPKMTHNIFDFKHTFREYRCIFLSYGLFTCLCILNCKTNNNTSRSFQITCVWFRCGYVSFIRNIHWLLTGNSNLVFC